MLITLKAVEANVIFYFEGGGMRLVIAALAAVFLSSCETGGSRGQSYAPPISEECRMARAEFQICYGGCLSSATGTFLQAAGKCGNECRRESLASARACR